MPEVSVLVVGAGPAGLMLAIELARRGVAFRLVDRHPQALGWDRATVVKPRSLELFDNLCLAETFVERGCMVPNATFFLNGAPVATVGFDDLDSRYAYLLSLPESETERILTEKLSALGGAVERDLELIGLEQNGETVRAHLRRVSTGEEADQDASWLVGTDGLHSAVREAVADPFEGHDNPLLWAVVDARMNGWRHDPHAIAVQLEKPAITPIPLRDGRWRIYFRPDAPGGDALAKVAGGLATMSPGATLGEHDEPRFFRTHSRVARNYRVGRVLLSGDAAHVCSPIQGHGMNVGIQDAHNLGWKLALVVQGHAPAALLDTYEAERRPIAHAIVASGDEAEKRFGGKESDIVDAVKRITDVGGHHRAVLAESEIGHCYRESPIVRDAGTDMHEMEDVTAVGCRVGDVDQLATRNGSCRLHELLRQPRHVLFVMLDQAEAATIEDGLRLATAAAERHRPHVDAYAVVRGNVGRTGFPQGLLTDPGGRLHRRLTGGGPGLCLVRPDGHLAFRGTRLALDELDACLARTFLSA